MKNSESRNQIAENIIRKLERIEFIASCLVAANLTLILISVVTNIVSPATARLISVSTFIIAVICLIKVAKILAKYRFHQGCDGLRDKEAA